MDTITDQQRYTVAIEMIRAYHAAQCVQAKMQGRNEPVVFWDNVETHFKQVFGISK